MARRRRRKKGLRIRFKRKFPFIKFGSSPTEKLCVWWQGRRSTSAGVRKHAVFNRCFKTLNDALSATRTIGRRRGSSALTTETSGLTKTLLTCRASRCKATHFGRKIGL